MIFLIPRRKFLIITILVISAGMILPRVCCSQTGQPEVQHHSVLASRTLLHVTVGTILTQTVIEEQQWTIIPIQQRRTPVMRAINTSATIADPASYVLAICGTEYCGDSLLVYMWKQLQEQALIQCIAHVMMAKEECYPPKMQSVIRTDDTLAICSELAECATRVTLSYKWDTTKSQWYKIARFVVDSSEIALAEARKAISQGRFGYAVAAYQSMAYSDVYMNVQDEVIRLIQSAAEAARTAALRKDFTTAYSIMDTVFTLPDAEYFLNYSTLDEVLQDFSTLDEPNMNFNGFRDVIGEYASYALRCKHYEQTIELTRYLVALDATYSPAYLWLADAQYAQGDKKTAQRTYKRYQELMTSAGKQRDIPKRVPERVR